MLHPAHAPDLDRSGFAQPKVAFREIRWLDAIRQANGFHTWADAARTVLEAIAADPIDPVNAHRFRAADFPPLRIKGISARYLNTVDNSICLYLTARVADHVGDLTRRAGFETRNLAIAAVLKVARRLDDGARYRPAGARLQ